MIEDPPGEDWLEGHISVDAALRGNRRTVHVVYIQGAKPIRDAGRLERLAGAAGVPVEKVDEGFLDANAGGRSHGGVLARVSQPRFSSLEELISEPVAPLVFMLDGVEDPFNFGQAVRAIYAAGADGLVVLNPGSPTDRRRSPRHTMAEISVEGGRIAAVGFWAVDEPAGPLDPELVRSGPR